MNRKTEYLVDVMSSGQKIVFGFLTLIWVAALVWFCHWWLSSDHMITWMRFLITSFVLFWSIFVPGYFFYFAGRMKRPNPLLPMPEGRVAMVVTKAPSEPWEIVRKTLTAALAQDYPKPYFVWLADEDPVPEVVSWCQSHGVGISSRKGADRYHNKKWPGRTRTKEGNLKYFYEKYGYRLYDFVVQMDADHVPEPGYLYHMIEPFRDPHVGYVAAPSICDANRNESWAVRARLYVEASMHGPLQAGYNGDGWAPLCIGSHYAVRTAALQMIGGLGPELAEDHSTSLLMNNGGWDGAFAIDAIAHGDGAGSFADSMTQEFQWARSLMNILLTWFPRFSKRLSLKKKFQFLFAETWYPIFATQMTLAIASPGIALFFKFPWVSVNYWEFLWRFWVLTLACILPVLFLRSQGWFRPNYAPVVSWETVLFQIVRWPWAVLGVLQAFLDSLFRYEFRFKVTPKGKDKIKPLGLITMLPYLVIIGVSGYLAIAVSYEKFVEGYRALALLDGAVYTLAVLTVAYLHFKENRGNARSRFSAVPVLVTGLMAVVLIFTAIGSAVPKFETSIIPSVLATPTPTPNYVSMRTQFGPTPDESIKPADQTVTQKIATLMPTVIPVFPTPTPLPVVELPTGRIFTGAYDPGGGLVGTGLDVDHYFVDWNYPTLIDSNIEKARKKGQFPMITVEPFNKPDMDPDTLLDDIAAGKYDDLITGMAKAIGHHAPQKVLIRIFHEMEPCREPYPWSRCDVGRFVTAWRHVVDLARQEGATNALWIWAPLGGADGTNSFYPGDSYTDYVATTCLVSEDWDKNYGVPDPPQSLERLLDQKYIGVFPKPYLCVELGISYSDPTVDRTKWLTDAFLTMKNTAKYPKFAGWIYFNGVTRPNPRINILPDFRVSVPELMDAIKAAGGF